MKAISMLAKCPLSKYVTENYMSVYNICVFHLCCKLQGM